MSISEVYGEFRCGKTQLSHTMSVLAQLPKEQGGAEGKVAYIDTEGTFRPERIAQIAERFGVDPDAAEENIAYARALNSEHQLELLNTLAKEFAGGAYKLLIIDSIMNCFRVDYCGRGELADRQQKLNQFLMKLAHMAEEFNVCVLMVTRTNIFHSRCISTHQTRRCRPTKSRATPAPVHSSPALMVASPSADISLPTPPPLVSCFVKDARRSVLRRSRIRQVSSGSANEDGLSADECLDCPEREATYIITTGGIADPDGK